MDLGARILDVSYSLAFKVDRLHGRGRMMIRSTVSLGPGWDRIRLAKRG